MGVVLVRVLSIGRAYGSLGSFEFACVQAGARMGRRIHSSSLGFTLKRLKVFRGRVGSRGGAVGPSCSSEFAWCPSFAPRGRRGHLVLRGLISARLVFAGLGIGIVGFIRVRIGSLRGAYGLSGSFGFAWFHLGRPWVVGFILVRLGSLTRDLWSSDSLRFAWVHWGAPKGRWVHSDSRGFTQALLWVIVLIRVQ